MRIVVKVLIIGLSVFQVAGFAVAQLDTDLQGYWQFNATNLDSSLAERDLDLIGGPPFSPGLIGCALDLNGNPAQYAIGIANGTVFDVGVDDFTIQIWVNFDSTGGEQTLFEKFTGGAGPGYTLTKLNDNRIQFFAAGLGVINSPVGSFVGGVWHQIVMRRVGDQFDIFFDNTSIVQAMLTGAVSPSPNPV